MSADIDPNSLPKPTKKQLREMCDDLDYWLKVARETPDKQAALVAVGVAMGTKRAMDTLGVSKPKKQ